MFPKSGESERFSALEDNVKRLLPCAEFLPLEKTVGGNDATPLLQSRAERGLFRQCFSTGVDHAVSNRRILRPTCNQSPAHLFDGSVAIIADDDHILRWCDVVTWHNGWHLVCDRCSETLGDLL